MCEIRGHEISGRLAFFTYLTVHMYYLGGVRGGRLKVLIDWISARLGNPQNQVMEGSLASVERVPVGADDGGSDRSSAKASAASPSAETEQ